MLSEVEAEVLGQPMALKSFLERRVVKAPAGSLFVGAGDSFAASSIACYLSSMKHSAFDPYELAAAPELANGRTVHFVSISGKTTSNLAAAKAVEGAAKERVAITANPRAKLLAVTERAILVPYRYVPRTPGTLSFSLSLLALLRLAAGDLECNFDRVHARARREADKLLFSEKGVTYFLGNGASFPASLYSALKMYEILGGRAQATMLEEFNHAGLFALKKQDAVNISCAFDPLNLGQRLCGALRSNGFRAATIPPFGSNPWEQVFHFIFLSQFAILRRAKFEGLSRPRFVDASGSLAISDSLIY